MNFIDFHYINNWVFLVRLELHYKLLMKVINSSVWGRDVEEKVKWEAVRAWGGESKGRMKGDCWGREKGWRRGGRWRFWGRMVGEEEPGVTVTGGGEESGERGFILRWVVGLVRSGRPRWWEDCGWGCEAAGHAGFGL